MRLADPASICVLANAALPSTSQLLTSGGDGRIAIDRNGANRYGCEPRPDAGILAFGSSTASTISETGFLAADTLRQKLQSHHARTPASIYAHELERMREDLGGLCGFGADNQPDMIFAASGTDLHLIAAALAHRDGEKPLDVIIAGIDETGRGVPMAVTGCHFSSSSALNEKIVEGTSCLDGAIRLHTVPVRDANGAPRNATAVDCDIAGLVRQAVSEQHRVLLIIVDVSKTGLIAPTPACAIALRNAFPDLIDLMVDACQFRIGSRTLQSYLKHGFMVALTASKFLTGPTFAGVLMLPEDTARGMRSHPLPLGLSDYSSRADWPLDWHAADRLSRTANYGLLLRWEAGLAELRRFTQVPEARIAAILGAFSKAVIARLKHAPHFAPLAVPPLERGAIASSGWDGEQTIFPFLLYCMDKQGGRRPLSGKETATVYQHLNRARQSACVQEGKHLFCEIGQPVAAGRRNGSEVSALRLCMSARLVADAASSGSAQSAIDASMQILDEVANRITAENLSLEAH